MNFLDPYITYAVGVADAERQEAAVKGESYSPASAFRVMMKLREMLPGRTDIKSKSISSMLGRLASDPTSPITRTHHRGPFGDVFYVLRDGAFAYEQVGCARCHGEGHKLVFMPLDHPIHQVRTQDDGKVIEGGFWAMCPKVHQPIIFGIVKAKDA